MQRLVIFGVALILAAPLAAHALLLPPRNLVTEITSVPEVPKPGQTVTFSAGVVGDGSGYTYVWTANGANVAEGIGVSKISLKAGGAGSVTNVEVTLVDGQGNIQGSQDYILRPAEVDLVWEAKSYVPPLYEGRPLPNQGSHISVQAIPRLINRGVPIPASQLTYAWSVDGKPLDGSAYGQSFITLTPPYFERPFAVTVRAKTLDGLFVGEGSVTIAPIRPFAVVYENQPLASITFNKAAPAGALTQDEVTYRMYPLFINDLSALAYQWKLNNKPFTLDTADPRSATFRKTPGATGSFIVGFSFSNPKNGFEAGENSFPVSIQ